VRYSVVVPVYDEAEGLPECVRRLTAVLDGLAGPAEVIFVDDGSRDGSRAILAACHRADPRIRVVALSRNFGHQAAISAGLAHSRGAAVAILDADLQDPPELLPALFGKLDEGWDVVYGVRRKRKEGLWKRFAYGGFYRLLYRLADVSIPHDAGDFCAMRRRVVDGLNALPEAERFVRGLRAWLGFRQTGLEYERDPRHAGAPKYTLARLVKLSLDGLVSFSAVPLRLMVAAGLVVSVASAAGILVVLYRYLFTPYVPGYTSLAILVLFAMGVQLLTVGVIGEYVGRIFQQVKHRPLFVVEERLGVDPPGPPGSSARGPAE
jgi:dolichol-phosphate mannosyltransferase